jgi:hypothetical protein
MYQGRKVCHVKDSCRCDLWPRPSDLDPKLHNNSLPLCIFETNEDFWLIFSGRMYQGIKVCHMKESCQCDLWPWLCDLETEIPFRSGSPKRMKIFGWYLVGGCIGCANSVLCTVYLSFSSSAYLLPSCCAVRSLSPILLILLHYVEDIFYYLKDKPWFTNVPMKNLT